MRILTCAAVAGLLALDPGAALAQMGMQAGGAIMQPLPSRTGPPLWPSSDPRRERDNYYLAPHEMLEVYGDYPLSNGETLRVTREGRRYFAAMPSIGKVEIVAVGSIAFVTRDRALRLDFTPVPFTTYVWVSRPGAPPATGQARG
ncbi:MAG TPA: hypothetical protein VGD30_08630 [Telluria sp.]